MPKVKIKINDQELTGNSGQTILDVARKNNIFIPALCHHPDFPAKANCRVCVVEINGQKKLQTACSALIHEGMEVHTDTERVKKSRNLNIELIFAEHIEKCPTCVWRLNCPLLDLAERYKLEICRFKDRKGKRKTWKFSQAVEIDGSQCIDCRNCLDACSKMQDIDYLELSGKGMHQEIVPTKNKEIDCIYCGQCAAHCPVGAAQEQVHWDKVESALKKKSLDLSNKIIVAQFAPSLRVSIGEEFGLAHGQVVTGQIVAGLRALGFDYVFDTNFGADITTVIEAGELLERLELNKQNNKKPEKKIKELPMITSCCPAWVKWLEFYRPDLIPNLTTSRSPQIHLGGVIKTYWAQKFNHSPKDIVVVSVMPCTAKKFEITRPELKINGVAPIDYVITTRELAWLFKKNRIDFAKIKSSLADDPLGKYTGSAVLYGGTGGVMESALRTAFALACGSKKTGACLPRIDFEEVRGLNGVKEAVVNIAGQKLNIAVVNGISEVRPVLENLKKYDYIEVMACVGGCIGGGGQPYPTTPEIRKKRLEALYKIDKKKELRRADENQEVLEILDWFKKDKGLNKKVLYTSYTKRQR